MRTDPYSSSTRVNGSLPSATVTVGRSSLRAIRGLDDLMTVNVNYSAVACARRRRRADSIDATRS